jgi:FSR family fosmidomycin resistance protein-like MFS transporter
VGTPLIESDQVVDAEPVDDTLDREGFQTELVFTVAGGHFVHDSFTAFVAPLLPILQDRLSTNYALTGGLAVFTQLPGLLNPFIGYLADRVSLRYFIIFAPAITATLMSSMGLTSSYTALALLLLSAGVSVAAFHAPAPAMIGRLASDRVGKGMSIFMASGELGRTVGPLLAVAAVGWFGLDGVWRLAIIGWLVSGVLFLRLRRVSARPQSQRYTKLRTIWPRVRRVFPAILWLTLARVFISVSLTTYLPIFMSDVKQTTLWLAAASLTILEGAGVVGALIAGTASDKLGRSRVLMVLLGVSPFLLFAFLYGPDWLALPLLMGLGLTTISPTPVIMAVVQDQFPDNRALANGIYLAMSFLIRALATWGVGLMADQIGLTNAYLFSGLVALLGLPAAMRLPPSPTSEFTLTALSDATTVRSWPESNRD